MAFTIPNRADAASRDQAGLDSVDFDLLTAGIAGAGVVSGLEVTAQSPEAMRVDYAAGTYIVSSNLITIIAGDVPITAADPSLPRFDLVVVNAAGTVLVIAGTPAALDRTFPAVPTGSIGLATVDVQAGVTAIGATGIVDKRLALPTNYGRLAQAQAWAALQTFNGGIAVVGSPWATFGSGTTKIVIDDRKIAFTKPGFPPVVSAINLNGVDLIVLGVLGITLPLGIMQNLKFVTEGAALQDENGNDRIVMNDTISAIATMLFPSANPLRTGDGKTIWNFGSAAPQNVTAGLGFTVVSNTPSPAAIVQGGSFNIGWAGTGTAHTVLGGEMLGILSGIGTITDLIGGRSRVQSNAAGTIPNAHTHIIESPLFAGAKPTTHAGLRVKNQGVAGITLSHGIIVEDQTGSAINVALSLGLGDVGFYGVTPVALQTGVAVTAAAIHAALVNLGLITA